MISKLQEFLNSKQFKKLMRNKDFTFSMLTYPIALLVYLILELYIKTNKLSEDTSFWYALSSFGLFTTIVFISIWERIEKRVSHTVQGDKLKMKQKENWRN